MGLAQLRAALGPVQRGALAHLEQVHLAPDHHAVDALQVLAARQQLAHMHVHAESAAVDLRDAQIDQLQQLHAEAGARDQGVEAGLRLVELGGQRTEVQARRGDGNRVGGGIGDVGHVNTP
ncbi:hypothetical protein SDC9_210746 [bioreactor metagenome]|uniref:Uncharacterized protein n=1 Tax=bioreactor metagenome TaxID=1076179 RepID=A0A645JIE2_9ZZZZ